MFEVWYVALTILMLSVFFGGTVTYTAGKLRFFKERPGLRLATGLVLFGLPLAPATLVQTAPLSRDAAAIGWVIGTVAIYALVGFIAVVVAEWAHPKWVRYSAKVRLVVAARHRPRMASYLAPTPYA